MHLVMTASMVVLESEGEECRKVPLSRLISLNKPEMPVLLLGTLAAVVSGVIFPMLGRRPGHARAADGVQGWRVRVAGGAPHEVGARRGLLDRRHEALTPRWNHGTPPRATWQAPFVNFVHS